MTRRKPLDYVLTVALLAVGFWEMSTGRVVFGLGFVVFGLLVLVSAFSSRVQSFMAWPRGRRETDRREVDHR
jgi:hypothetical protein